ncbi:SfnB family sulfur acquisition oxidoreductase [Thermobifida cellulosilytica]|uniref:Dibenzothiophene monooxygenase n=1 Tax=Thermobifida cellulosilytica TB100 TaxID=665004 RepID=A0A147KIH3_THECS|nr:SfnB family sulfur acquisition oxidoreductase [Thermobifida cellulosilytica]KUP97093.1 monooxygenase [Thermobifida cellulosilytica TB100]
MTDTVTAHVVSDDDEAVRIARDLVPRLAVGADRRDAERELPWEQVAQIRASGLLGITVPRSHGGAGAAAATVAEALRLVGTVDLSLAQILQPHFAFLDSLRRSGGEEVRNRVFADVLAGALVGNAQAERTGRNSHEQRTRLEPAGDGRYRITGVKYYATGSLFAQWLAVTAKVEVPGFGEPQPYVVFVPRDAPGVEVVDDWDGMGQRTTGSGTVRLTGVEVPAERVVPHYLTFTGPTTYGAFAQLGHASIDVGLARGALERAAEFVRTRSRAWFESGSDTASEDPLVIQQFGELELQVRAAEALVQRAAAAVDAANADPTDDTTAEASIAVAAAKAAGGRAAVAVSNALFEVAGTRSAADGLNLHRYWRDARTHTLHDPVRWKIQHIGRYSLNGRRPPRHGQI